jgi:hypothetical protein
MRCWYSKQAFALILKFCFGFKREKNSNFDSSNSCSCTLAIAGISVRIERLRVESQRAGLKFKIMLKAQQSKNGTVTFHQHRGKKF